MKRINIIEASVALGLILSVLLSVMSFGFNCEEIRNNVIRLHVLANSDSEEDQKVKLMVRDALLNSGTELFSGKVTVENAEGILKSQKDELTAIANKVLKDNGFNYTAYIYIIKEHFTTRSYEDFTLPAGEYLALKVILGKGEGENWWCVMFPPLCLPAATKTENMNIIIGDEGAKIVQNYSKYEIRFKIVEVYEGIKNHFKNKIT